MPEGVEQRDFFISFNSADLAYAEAVDTALRAEGFSTFFHPNDLLLGDRIPQWMDQALMNARQMLALYSPDYVSSRAVYSEAERYAQFSQDPKGEKRKVIPVVLKAAEFTPLFAGIKRIEVEGKPPKDAAAAVVAELKNAAEKERRNYLRSGLPQPKIFNSPIGPTRISPAGSKLWNHCSSPCAPAAMPRSPLSPAWAGSARRRWRRNDGCAHVKAPTNAPHPLGAMAPRSLSPPNRACPGWASSGAGRGRPDLRGERVVPSDARDWVRGFGGAA